MAPDDIPHGPYTDLQQLLAVLDDSALLERLQDYRHTGRPGWSLRALWQAYLASFYLDLPHTNALIRRLQDDPGLRAVCGFDETDGLPCRRTFNRYIRRLADHTDLVAATFYSLTHQLRELLPGFGDMVAIDSTDVRSYSNPNKKSRITGELSDPEARWGVKHSARSRGSEKTEYFFGYKVHMVVDATNDLPLTFKVTAGNRNDSPELPAVMGQAFETYEWFAPQVALADRGYDAKSNFEYLYLKQGIDPVIHIRNRATPMGSMMNCLTRTSCPCAWAIYPWSMWARAEKANTFSGARAGAAISRKGSTLAYCIATPCSLEDPAEHLRILGGTGWPDPAGQ